MISQKIRSTVRTMIDLYKEERFTKADFLNACDVLLDCSDQVAQIEHRPIPIDMRGWRLGENVIPVDFRLRAGELIREPAPTGDGAA